MDVVSSNRKQNQKCSSFPALRNIFLFSAFGLWLIRCDYFAFGLTLSPVKQVLRRLLYRLSFCFHWNSVNITSHLIWVHHGPKCVPQQCLANITIKREIKNLYVYASKNKINITFPLCLKPTTNVSIPSHTRHASAFLLPAKWPWAEICKS